MSFICFCTYTVKGKNTFDTDPSYRCIFNSLGIKYFLNTNV